MIHCLTGSTIQIIGMKWYEKYQKSIQFRFEELIIIKTENHHIIFYFVQFGVLQQNTTDQTIRCCNIPLVTMCFRFYFDCVILFHLDPNYLNKSASHCCGGLLSSLFQSLGYHSAAAWVRLLSVNFATCPLSSSSVTSIRMALNYINLFV